MSRACLFSVLHVLSGCDRIFYSLFFLIYIYKLGQELNYFECAWGVFMP